MTPKNWIIDSIIHLVNSMPHLRIRYENHVLSNTHFLEVVPNSIFHLSKEYKTKEEELTFQFIQKFPNQNICFISDDAIVGIDNVDFEVKGGLFNLIYSENVWSYHLVRKINFQKRKFEPINTSPVVTDNSQFVLSDISEFSLKHSLDTLAEPPALAYQEIIRKSLVEKSGESNYAMAA